MVVKKDKYYVLHRFSTVFNGLERRHTDKYFGVQQLNRLERKQRLNMPISIDNIWISTVK